MKEIINLLDQIIEGNRQKDALIRDVVMSYQVPVLLQEMMKGGESFEAFHLKQLREMLINYDQNRTHTTH